MDGVSWAAWDPMKGAWVVTGVEPAIQRYGSLWSLLTEEQKRLILSLQEPAMFTPKERQAIELKALEQALREAGVAHTEPEPIFPTPTVTTWPFVLTEDDRVFLRINKISAR